MVLKKHAVCTGTGLWGQGQGCGGRGVGARVQGQGCRGRGTGVRGLGCESGIRRWRCGCWGTGSRVGGVWTCLMWGRGYGGAGVREQGARVRRYRVRRYGGMAAVPVATLRVSSVASLMMGLCVNLVSLPATTVVLWQRSTSRSSCFCSSTRMSSSSTTCSSICFDLPMRHVSGPSWIIRWRVRSRFCATQHALHHRYGQVKCLQR